MRRRETTVTRDGWGVSVETSTARPGAELHVYRLRMNLPNAWGGQGRFQKGEGYGRRFETTDEAFAWALERGYLQIYRPRTWCPIHRTLHFRDTFYGLNTRPSGQPRTVVQSQARHRAYETCVEQFRAQLRSSALPCGPQERITD